MKIKILVIGDIVGRPGRDFLKDKLSELLRQKEISFCVANAENTAGGSGITPEITEELLSYGINVLTSGDHIWKRKEIIPILDANPRLLRPANYSSEAAGKGFNIFDTAQGHSIAVINLVGRTFMPPVNCPFHAVDEILSEVSTKTNLILVDFHAEATSDKVAMGWHLDGKVGFLFGTHTHIQTADERILPGGTAYITDLGMTGPYDSVLGRKIEKVLSVFITGVPTHFDVAEDDVRLCGALVTLDTSSGKALSIERIVIKAS